MWPFTHRPFLDPETADWQIENTEWMVETFGAAGALFEGAAVLPNDETFPLAETSGHERAERIFKIVRERAGLTDWPITLVPDSNPNAERPAYGTGIESSRHAVGMFMPSEDGVQISYATALLDRPQQLVATLAHELAHYLLMSVVDRPCAEPDEEEFLTDLAAVFLGFGVFVTNGRSFHETIVTETGVGAGWGSAGYLPENDLVFATALWALIAGGSLAEIRTALKPHLRKPYDRSLAQLEGDERVARIRMMILDMRGASS